MNEQERLDEALRRLKPEDSPDPRLEERVVSALRARGLVGSRPVFAKMSIAAAALIAGFALGWLSQPLAPELGESARSDQASFLLLLGGDVDAAPITVPALHERVEAHRAWAAGLRRAGHLIASEKLAGAGEWLEQPRAVPISRVAVGDERLLGFFLIRAENLAEAIELSRGCPNLAHGGSVTVYPIDPT